ncbi:hypothetical protein ACFL1U_01905 [Patescibacteria group bacterium]
MTTEVQTIAQKLIAALSKISATLTLDCHKIIQGIEVNLRLQSPILVDAVDAFDKNKWRRDHILIRDRFSHRLEDAYEFGVKEQEYRKHEAVRVSLSFKETLISEGYDSIFLFYDKKTGEFLGGLLQSFERDKLISAVEYHCDVHSPRKIVWAMTRELRYPLVKYHSAPTIDPRINEIIEEQGQILIDEKDKDTGHLWKKTMYLRPADEGSKHRRLYEDGLFLTGKPSTGVDKGAKWFKIIEWQDGKKHFIIHERDGGQKKGVKWSEKNGLLPDMRLKLQRMFNIRVSKGLFPKELKIK